MKISADHSDDAILAELGVRLARTRLERDITQAQLATEAGVAKATIERMERGEIAKLPSLIRVLRALDLLDALDGLLPEPLPSPIEQLKLQGRRRRRASGGGAAAPTDVGWSWGEGADDRDAGDRPVNRREDPAGSSSGDGAAQ